MTITWMTFAIRLLVGFFLAVGIGIERQWLKTREVLKTNVLVTLGSAMFVMLSIMIPGDASPTRIASQIVSGVGFLGGGVILREGASVKGINTAATLWCAAAIGALVGSGFLVQAYVSTLAIVGANLLLRPLVKAFKQKKDDQDLLTQDDIEQMKNESANSANNPHNPLSLLEPPMSATPGEYQYTCHLFCALEAETKVLELMMKFAKERHLTVVEVQSKNIFPQQESGSIEVEIKANFVSPDLQPSLKDSVEIIRMFKTEAMANSISWQLQAA